MLRLLLLLRPLLHKTSLPELLLTAVLHVTARSLAFNYPWLQTPSDFAPITWIARYLHCFYFLLRYCPAAFNTRGKLPSTVRFKTTRGKTASMELGDLSRHGKQFMREVSNAIGRSEGVWRVNLTNGCNSAISSDENRVRDLMKCERLLWQRVAGHFNAAADALENDAAWFGTVGDRRIREFACFRRGDTESLE
jgi:hypothetical protein